MCLKQENNNTYDLKEWKKVSDSLSEMNLDQEKLPWVKMVKFIFSVICTYPVEGFFMI